MARVSRKHRDASPDGDCVRGEKTYKVAAYVRLSDEDIRKKISDSIGTQKSMLVRFIETQPDLQLYEIYEDVNCTGTNFNRPAFTRMIADIEAGLVNCVLVKDLSRFGRSFEEMGHFLERVFPFLEVRFISVSDNYDSLTASLDESSLIVPLKNLMNEVYARDVSRKVQSSVKLKQKRGEFVGSIAPYGYIKNGTAFIVDPETAPIVRQIFGWIIEGMSDIAIAQKLNDMKILPPSRYRFEKGITKASKHEYTRFWYKSTIQRITVNPAYTGVMAQGKYKSNFLHGGGTIHTSSDEWVLAPDTHPAIIDTDTFAAVKKIREARKQNYKVDKNGAAQENIFKGRIFCGECNSCMVRNRLSRVGGDEYYFLCNLYEQVDKNACNKKRVMESEVRAALFAYISREINITVDMNRIITELRRMAVYQKRRNTLEKQIDIMEKKLAHNRRFRSSLREDYRDGILSEQDYAVLRADYDLEKEALQQELDILRAENIRQDSTCLPENRWITEFTRFESEQKLSAQMVSALVERIDVYSSKRIGVVLRHRDEFELLREYLFRTATEVADRCSVTLPGTVNE